jgi:hypothetical protein
VEGTLALAEGMAVASARWHAVVRRCTVTVTTSDGVTHVVEVQDTNAFEVVQVEVHISPTIYNIPLRALLRWARRSECQSEAGAVEAAIQVVFNLTSA